MADHRTLFALCVALALTTTAGADRRLVAWGANYNGTCDVPATAFPFSRVVGGALHSIAIGPGGTVTCWGAGSGVPNDPVDYGQTIVPAAATSVIEDAGGNYHTMALRSNGTVACWGAGVTGVGPSPTERQSVVPVDTSSVTSVSGDGLGVVALNARGMITVWGAPITSSPVKWAPSSVGASGRSKWAEFRAITVRA